MNDDFLTPFREPPRPEFAASLYQRISKPMLRNGYVRRQLAWITAVVVVISTLILVASPNARALAADLLRRIGVLTISSRPVGEPVIIASPLPEQLELAGATATPISPAAQTSTPMENAIAEAGFLPYLPGYLPAGYSQVNVVAAEYIDDQQVPYGMGIFVDYTTDTGGYLSIQTNRFDGRAQDIPMGGTSITDVTVSGQAGVWIEGLPFQSPLSSGRSTNMLLWQEGDYVLAIQADQLSREEVLKIAERLSQ